MNDRDTKRSRCEDHVGVGEKEPRTPRALRPAPEGVVLAQPARGQVVDPEHPQRRVRCSELAQHVAGAVGRAVVDGHDLEARVVLGEH